MNTPDRCEIARDLMPLSIDGVCSESSQRFLDDHLSECPPCKSLYTRMKSLPLPQLQPEPNQEAQALKRGLKYLGKRFKALWIALAALVCAFVVMMVAAGVNQIVWNWKTDVPLDMYELRITSTSALANIIASGDFSQFAYSGCSLKTETVSIAEANLTGYPEAVNLIYTLEYYPNQARKYANQAPADTALIGFKTTDQLYADNIPLVVNDNNTFVITVSDFELCRDGNNLYLIGGMEGCYTSDATPVIVLDPGMPINRIYIKDGDYAEVIYQWGDGFDIYPEALDENGLPASKILLRKDYETLVNTPE